MTVTKAHHSSPHGRSDFTLSLHIPHSARESRKWPAVSPRRSVGGRDTASMRRQLHVANVNSASTRGVAASVSGLAAKPGTIELERWRLDRSGVRSERSTLPQSFVVQFPPWGPPVERNSLMRLSPSRSRYASNSLVKLTGIWHLAVAATAVNYFSCRNTKDTS